jgi:hypothetical protein
MTAQSIILGLVAYILFREIFFLYSTQKLINKIMSRSFFDYQQGLRVGKTEEGIGGKVQEDLADDLSTLNGIGVL